MTQQLNGGIDVTTRRLTPSEIRLISDFFVSLREEDPTLFFHSLSRQDQYYLKLDLELDEEGVLELLEEVKVNFRPYIDHPGVGDVLTFENAQQTKGYVVVLNNIQTDLRYLKETEVEGLRLPIEMDGDQLKIKIFLEN